MKIAICCSMKMIDLAQQIKEKLDYLPCGVVCYIPSEPEKDESMIDHLEKYLDNLDASDLVFILKKPDGTIGESVAYEMAYCIHNAINYLIIDPVNPVVRF